MVQMMLNDVVPLPTQYIHHEHDQRNMAANIRQPVNSLCTTHIVNNLPYNIIRRL